MDSGGKIITLHGSLLSCLSPWDVYSRDVPASRDVTVLSGTQAHPSLNRETFDVRCIHVGILTVPSFDDDSAISAHLLYVVGTEYNKHHNSSHTPFPLSLQSGCPCILIDHSLQSGCPRILIDHSPRVVLILRYLWR